MAAESTSSTSNFTDAATFSAPKMATLDIISVNKTEIFTKEECNSIIESSIEELWLPATVVGGANLHQSRRQKLRGEITGFPFLNIRDATKTANTDIFDFNLLGIIDQDYPQVFKYSENDFYKMHMDLNPMTPSRKITFIINLSDPDSYEGGDLNFLNINAESTILNEQGSCLAFPSYMAYSISPVTKGTKHIIIGHVHGALFK
jgi:PKHD-type hydroxylase